MTRRGNTVEDLYFTRKTKHMIQLTHQEDVFLETFRVMVDPKNVEILFNKISHTISQKSMLLKYDQLKRHVDKNAPPKLAEIKHLNLLDHARMLFILI
jgi:hypothetical protein